jgi:ankyrin repeat protein
MTIQEEFQDDRVVGLISAVLGGDFAKADQLLAQGADINAVGKNGLSPLFWVMTAQANLQQTEYMLKVGANPNYVDPTHKISAMYIAAGGDKTEFLELLLHYKGNPNLVGPHDKSLLMVAMSSNRSDDHIKILLSNGADINWFNSRKESVAWQAVVNDRFDLVLYFLEHGYTANLDDLESYVESVVASKDSQKNKEKVIDTLKAKGVITPAWKGLKIYIEKNHFSDKEIQDLVYGRQQIDYSKLTK